MSRCKGGHDHPYVAAPVGKWWGLFQVLPLAAPGNGGAEPRVLSWHATVGEAEAAASALARWDASKGSSRADKLARQLGLPHEPPALRERCDEG